MILRDSDYVQDADISTVLKLAKGARSEDEEGYRAEFIRIVETSRFLASRE